MSKIENPMTQRTHVRRWTCQFKFWILWTFLFENAHKFTKSAVYRKLHKANRIKDKKALNNTTIILISIQMTSLQQSQSSSVQVNFRGNDRTSPTTTRRRAAKFSHSPIVMAMLTGNTNASCADAESLLEECLRTGSNDRICEAAARRVDSCIMMRHQDMLEKEMFMITNKNWLFSSPKISHIAPITRRSLWAKFSLLNATRAVVLGCLNYRQSKRKLKS